MYLTYFFHGAARRLTVFLFVNLGSPGEGGVCFLTIPLIFGFLKVAGRFQRASNKCTWLAAFQVKRNWAISIVISNVASSREISFSLSHAHSFLVNWKQGRILVVLNYSSASKLNDRDGKENVFHFVGERLVGWRDLYWAADRIVFSVEF